MPHRSTSWIRSAVVAIAGGLAVTATACGRDEPTRKDAPATADAPRATSAPGATSTAGGTSGPGAAAAANGEDAKRSMDPAVAGPALFDEFRRFADSGDLSILLALVPAERAQEMRKDVERELERCRKDPDHARTAQERMGLPKSPAEMTFEEFTREVAASMKRSGFARSQVDQEAGTRYLAATLEAPAGGGEPILVVRAEGTDAAGAPTTRESVFVRSDGRWALDMDASHDRGMGLVRRIRLEEKSPNALAFAGDAVLVGGTGLRRYPLAKDAPATAAPEAAWVGAVHVAGTHVFYQVEGAWRHATLPDLATAAALPEGVQHVAASPSRPEAYLATGAELLRLDLDAGTTTKAFAFPDDSGGVLALHALPGDRVLVRPRQGAALEARALADGSRVFAVPLPELHDSDPLFVAVGGNVLAVADGNVVNLYDANDGAFLRKLTADRRIEALAVAPDGRLLALDTSQVHVHRVSDGAELRVLSAQPGSVTPPLAFDATGRRLAALLREGRLDADETPYVGLYRFD